MWVCLRIFLQLVGLFGFFLLPVAGVSWWFQEPYWVHYIMIAGLSLLAAATTWLPFFRALPSLRSQDGFLLLTSIWFGLGFLSAIPLWVVGDVSWVDALFSGVSGLTTTGAEVFADLSILPVSLLFYRVWLQFIGGLGVVILALALLPMLGVTHSHSMQADLPGPTKGLQIAPQMVETAQSLWILYVSLWLLCFLSLEAVGLDIFSAMCESFSIVSTGGYGLHNDNLGYYHSHAVMGIAMLFAILSSINFSLHYRMIMFADWQAWLKNRESRYFLLALLVFSVFFGVFVNTDPFQGSFSAVFTVVSVMTSAGHHVVSYEGVSSFLVFVLMMLGLFGACSGSTSGGMKWARLLFLLREMRSAVALLLHPRAILPTTIQTGKGSYLQQSDSVLVRGYLVAFMLTWFASLAFCLYVGLDFSTSFSAVIACLSNTGVGFFGVASNFATLPDAINCILIGVMLVGRIELLAFLVVLSPSYWRMRL